MTKYWKVSFCMFFLFLSVLIKPKTSFAETSPNTYSIYIVKYRLEESMDIKNFLMNDGLKIDDLTDGNGNKLSRMSDVHYEINKLKRKEGMTDSTLLSSYEPASGSEQFSMEVVTDTNGEASINGLPEGAYQVTEKNHKLIKQVMDPVLVNVPLNSSNGILNDVYLYPKSSVVLEDEDEPTKPTSPKKLPQTSGSIGTNHQIFFMLIMSILFGCIGLKQFKK